MNIAIIEALRQSPVIEAFLFEGESLGIVEVMAATSLHAGDRLDSEILNQGAVESLHVLVAIKGRGIFHGVVSRRSEALNGLLLTHLVKVENPQRRMEEAEKVSKERGEEVKAVLLSALACA